MDVELIDASRLDAYVDALVLDLDQEGKLGSVGAAIDQRMSGFLSEWVRRGEATGKVGDCTTVFAPIADVPRVVTLVGIGSRDSLDATGAYRAAGTALKTLAARPRQRVALGFPEAWSTTLWEAAICGAMAAVEGQDLYRAQKRLTAPGTLYLVGGAALDGVRESGACVGNAMQLTRRLVNEPPNRMFPETLAAKAREVAGALGLECEVWDKTRLEAEKCRALLAVASGSEAAPCLITLRYRGNASPTPDLALVGKGVTFDSGGLSIKPTESMKDMKCDMAGAATVLGAMQAIAQLKLPLHVTMHIGAVENMLSGRAYRVGDVLESRSGKTIEILNTDAEGRVVLADVLDVAAEQRPQRMIDVATLTGACMVALGSDATGLMTNQSVWGKEIEVAAQQVGEPLWQLPMFAYYSEQIRSQVADIKNTGDGRWGGAITAAKFLEEFVQGIPWAHLDIAGPAFAEQAKGWREAGATGAMVRTLVQVARRLT